MRQRSTMMALLIAVSTAMAVRIGPFTSWDDLTAQSPDIVVARCTTTPNPTSICEGMIWSDIEVLAVLKGDAKLIVTGMVSQYWPHQDERFLMFATYQSNGFYQAYNATETYRIVPLGHYFQTNGLTGKSLKEQIQLVLRSRLEELNRELERGAKEKNRLEEGLKK